MSLRGRHDQYGFGRGWTQSYDSVELTHLSEGWVCGKITMSNDDNSLSGSFAVPVKPQN